MTSNAMEFFALGSEDKVHLSDSEISDLYDEEDGDSGDGDDKEADRVRMERLLIVLSSLRSYQTHSIVYV
jgi:hypothetical protein